MPIKQDRVIAIINAGLDYQQALEQLSGHIRREAEFARIGKQTHQEALSNLETMCNIKFILQNSMQSPSTLAIENAYFKRNKNRNASAAKWQANKRRGAPTQAQGTKQTARPPDEPHNLDRGSYEQVMRDVDAASAPAPAPVPYESGTATGEDFPDELTVTSEGETDEN